MHTYGWYVCDNMLQEKLSMQCSSAREITRSFLHVLISTFSILLCFSPFLIIPRLHEATSAHWDTAHKALVKDLIFIPANDVAISVSNPSSVHDSFSPSLVQWEME